MLGDGDAYLDRPAPESGLPVHPAPPAKGPMDGVLGRVLIQGVGMLGVAAIVLAVVDDRADSTHARIDALEAELELARYERDRMQRLSTALTEELDEVSVEAEIVRWQLRYTEERYARLRDAANAEDALAALDRAHKVAPVPGIYGVDASLPVNATFVSLDHPGAPTPDAQPLDPAAAVLAAAAAPSTTDAEVQYGGVPIVAGPGRTQRPTSLLELESLDGSAAPPATRQVGSQLDRDRAFAVWSNIVEEAAVGECARRSGAAERKCRDRVRRRLMPWGSSAVDCMLSGNAAADYVASVRLDQLPTHSVPLEEGAVILCDGGLRNL